MSSLKRYTMEKMAERSEEQEGRIVLQPSVISLDICIPVLYKLMHESRLVTRWGQSISTGVSLTSFPGYEEAKNPGNKYGKSVKDSRAVWFLPHQH